MKNAVFTLYKAKNYGTHLQAYAIYNIIKKLKNEDVVILSEENERLTEKLKFIKSKNPFKIKKRLNFLRYNSKFNEAFIVGEFQSTYHNLIIGSDELWNVRNKDFQHSDYYLGSNFKADNIISYAISCNRCTHSEFRSVYGDNPFINLSAISVRDKMTLDLLESYGIKDVQRVLDPTFLYDFKVKNQLDSNYILVYGYYFTEDEQKKILNFAREKNLKLVAVGFEHDWCDYYKLCSTEDFLSYVYYSDYVITSTFHGSVFSIKFNKQFASFGRDNLKVLDLIDHFGLSQRNATPVDLNTIFSNQIDYIPINEQISRERDESLKWLKNHLI